jgi:alkanesulfonate monooxygenase SsuD/methylene tetrahydromethanopterin reductase-like flavin-dependent oxidoreductase (luciferase family)
MEFGLFLQGYVPGPDAHDADREHEAFMREVELVVAADKANWKFAWFSEHHALTEYSHLSSSEVMMGYLFRATERIHLGSGIFNLSPRVNHPVRNAERVAMLDHLSEGRFEFGTGRGAGSHEILGFHPGMSDLSGTREIWEETIGEFAKMWLQDEYEGFEGKHWALPPRKVLPKPWKKPHPAMWYAAGNTTSYAMAASKGLGVLGFSVGSIDELGPVMKAYKDTIPSAEPVGAYVNDNIMVTAAAFVKEDGEQARKSALGSTMSYLQSNVFRYHDTFPHPPEVPAWPELLPDPTPEALDYAVGGGLICGDPDHALEQCRRWEASGADQLVFGMGMVPQEDSLEMIRLMGEHVIPKIDTDPVHRTTRFRDAAAG